MKLAFAEGSIFSVANLYFPAKVFEICGKVRIFVCRRGETAGDKHIEKRFSNVYFYK